MSVKLSVIIPLYNCEKYIGACLNSVMEQTFSDWEALVVDDGSTDGSGEICRALAEKDRRIRLISQENRGVSTARNRAMDEARGEYLFFLDSDDAIHPRLLEELVQKAEETGVELAFSYTVKLNDGDMEGAFRSREEPSWRLGEGSEVRRWFFQSSEQGVQLRQMGGKFLSRKLLSGLRFEKGLLQGEDTLFLYRLVQKDPRTLCLENPWYVYRMRAGSLTHSLGPQSLDASRKVFQIIREEEGRAGERANAVAGHQMLLGLLLSKMELAADHPGQKAAFTTLREMVREERKHSLYREIHWTGRIGAVTAIYCWPLHRIMKWGGRMLGKVRKKEG